jgi:hypothetical protein
MVVGLSDREQTNTIAKTQQSMVCCIARQVALDIRGVDKNDFCGLGQFCVGTSWHELPVVLIGMSIATQGAELSSRRFGSGLRSLQCRASLKEYSTLR